MRRASVRRFACEPRNRFSGPSQATGLTETAEVSKRAGFTLIELLIVITIIAMLSTLTLMVVGSAMQTARKASTESTVARIDAAVCEMYETYANRRIDVRISKLPAGLNSPEMIAKIRLHFLHDLMRMEMPTFWEEVVNPPQPFLVTTADNKTIAATYTDGTPIRVEDSPLRLTYLEAFRQGVFAASGGKNSVNIQKDEAGSPFVVIDYAADSPHVTVRKNSQAKLLYQIVMNGIPESREMFGEKGIDVPDGDDLPCFVDAWGKPIYFLRWAPGFTGSNRQPDLWKWTGSVPDHTENPSNEEYWRNNLSPDTLLDKYFEQYADLRAKTYGDSGTDILNKIGWEGLPYPGAPYFFSAHGSIFDTLLKYPDPCDLAKIRRLGEKDTTGSVMAYSRPGFLLVPLVYSAGPDGEYGISIPSDEADKDAGTAIGEKLLILDPFKYGHGAPFGNKGHELDNIHNHRLGGR